MDETTAATSAPAQTIVVEVDLSSLEDSFDSLQSEVSDLRSSLESMAAVQETLLVESNDLQAMSVNSTDSAAVAILIFIGIILSFSITLWLFRK